MPRFKRGSSFSHKGHSVGLRAVLLKTATRLRPLAPKLLLLLLALSALLMLSRNTGSALVSPATLAQGDPFDASGSDKDKDSQLVGVDVDVDEVQADEAEEGGEKVCLHANNPRTASVFLSGFLRKRGRGRLVYVSQRRRCEKDMPVVRLVFQKDLRKLDSLSDRETLVVQGDEYCRCPFRTCEDGSIIQARQYYNRQYDKSAAQSVPMYLPLGPRLDFLKAKIAPSLKNPKPASQRNLLLNLVVSPTNPTRKRLAAILEEQKAVLSTHGKGLFVHITPSWSAKFNDTAAGFISTEKYKNVLASSVFTLCPAGHNPEAFRIFEACEAGSIPVIALDNLYSSHSCEDAFRPFIETNAPFVVVKDWAELPQKLADLVKSPAKLDALQLRMLEWRDSFWKNITQRFECTVLMRARGSTADLPADCSDSEGGFRFRNDGLITGLKRIAPRETKVPASLEVIKNGVPLVTGCGRSGTFSLADYLKSIGIPAIHEGINHGHVSVSWLYAAKDRRYPFESRSSARLRVAKYNLQKPGVSTIFGPVVHLVRHPLKVISSTRRCFCGKGTKQTRRGRISDKQSWLFVQRHVKDIDPTSSFDDMKRSSLYWLKWNSLIETNYPGASRFQLETLKPHNLVVALGLKGKNVTILPEKIPHSSAHVSPQGPKKKYPDVTWKDLYDMDQELAKQIWAKAQDYGYEVGKTLEDALAMQ